MLQPLVDYVYEKHGRAEQAPRLQRNTLQSDGGGHDVVGLDWIALEVKCQEKLNLRAAWEQCCMQARRVGSEPVLLYKRNNTKFTVRLMGWLECVPPMYCPIDVSEDVFCEWFTRKLDARLQTEGGR